MNHHHHAPLVDFNQPHVPLTNFRVLYIGRAAPKATLNSVEAIQKPLYELYTKDDRQSRETDVDAVLTVFTSGLLMAPVNPLDNDFWLPIQNLQSCAAVKAVVDRSCQGGFQDGQLSFVPVDSTEARKSPYPPIFAVTMGRSNGLPLTDCYAFIIQSSESALLAVQATMQSFSNERGWADDRPNTRGLVSSQCSKPEIIMDQNQDFSTPSEFYERPPLKGFFYAPSAGLIQKFHIRGQGSYSNQEQTPYIPERPFPVAAQPPPVTMYERDWDRRIVAEDIPSGFMAVDKAYMPSAGPGWGGGSSRIVAEDIPSGFMAVDKAYMPSAGPGWGGGSSMGQAMAFNPYLVPAADLPPGAPQPVSISVSKPKRHEEETIIVPVIQESLRMDPRGYGLEQESAYQKRMPRRSDLTYSNRVDTGLAPAAVNPSPVGQFRRSGTGYVAKVEQPVEDLYAHRLPPPAPEPLPNGARQFDSNFILQQTDTDKARIAEIRSFPSPQLGIADFGF